jgi:hypothetical protein
MTGILSKEQIAAFHRNGYVVIPSFYDRQTEIEPIQRAVYGIIGMVIRRHKLDIVQAPFRSGTFDSGFNELIAVNRAYGGEVYDAVKLIPAFVRLAASKHNEDAVRLLRQTEHPGFISRGYGMRIDLPQEDHLRAHWHQEYLFQLRSVDGLIFWSPLIEMTESLGPVVIGRASHRHGIFPVTKNDSARGAYSWRLKNEVVLASQYEHVAPLTKPGDVLIMDFLALHCSGDNIADRARWSMQMRFFNFEESTGFRHGWPGSVTDGVGFEKYHPECLAAIEEAA